MSDEGRVRKESFPSRVTLHAPRVTLHVLLGVGVCVAILMAGLARATALDRPMIESVSHTSATDYTRVVIALSGATVYRLLAVPADSAHSLPPRLVIDFSPARLGAGVPLSLPIHDGLLTQVRTSQFSPTTARIVLDVERLDEYKTFALPSPYRVIIDVKGKGQHEAAPPRESLPTPRYKIMLDPGHGGHDPGARGGGRVQEKDVVLTISQRLGRKLATRLPVDVLFTRTADVFVPLEGRIAHANAAGADLFVSIHANASTNPARQGIETYYLNNSNDRATIRLAALENGLWQRKDGERREASLSYLLSDLIQTGKEEDSIALAHHLQDAVVLRARERYPAVHNLGVKQGPFYVLVGAYMPCVLVETAFITHSVEGKHLISAEYQEALAEGLFLGIARFLRATLVAKSL